jgi:hypothetical protein
MKIVLNKKTVIKLGKGDMLELKIGDPVPSEVLMIMGDENVNGLLEQGIFADVTEAVEKKQKRIADAAQKAKKAADKKAEK